MTRLSNFNQPWKSMEVATVPCTSAGSKCMQILEENWSASYVKALIVHEDLCLVNQCLSCMNYFTAGCRRSMPGRNSSVQEGLKVICCSATIQPFMTDRMSVWTQHSSILTGLHDCPGYGIAACCIVANFMQYWWSLMRPMEPGAIGQLAVPEKKRTAFFGTDRKGLKTSYNSWLHVMQGRDFWAPAGQIEEFLARKFELYDMSQYEANRSRKKKLHHQLFSDHVMTEEIEVVVWTNTVKI